jgi:hypothetical protein
MNVYGICEDNNKIMVIEDMSKNFYTLPAFIDHIIGNYADNMGMDHNDVINMLLHLAAHYDDAKGLYHWYNENE